MTKAIVGNCLAALVAAVELGKAGRSTALFSNGKRWGGHFAGIDLHGVHYDLGMSVVELSSDRIDKDANYDSYDPSVRNDVGRFFGRLQGYVNSLVSIHNVKAPECFFRGALVEDFILCNSFDLLSHLSESEKTLIAEQLRQRSSTHALHASNKVTQQNLHSRVSYAESSQFNHGQYLHSEVIEPFVRKITARASENVSSILHRRIWAPLYYPETLLQALKGSSPLKNKTDISYPKDGSFASFAAALLGELKKYRCVSVYDDPIVELRIDSNTLSTRQGDQIHFQDLAWGGPINDLGTLIGASSFSARNTDRTSLAFDFLLVKASDLKRNITIVFVIDEQFSCFRVTNQTACAGSDESFVRLVVEYNLEYLCARGISEDAEIHQETLRCLHGMGVLARDSEVTSTVKRAERLLPIPNHDYESEALENIRRVKALAPQVALFGESSGVATRSFADNFVQGLKLSG